MSRNRNQSKKQGGVQNRLVSEDRTATEKIVDETSKDETSKAESSKANTDKDKVAETSQTASKSVDKAGKADKADKDMTQQATPKTAEKTTVKSENSSQSATDDKTNDKSTAAKTVTVSNEEKEEKKAPTASAQKNTTESTTKNTAETVKQSPKETADKNTTSKDTASKNTVNKDTIKDTTDKVTDNKTGKETMSKNSKTHSSSQPSDKPSEKLKQPSASDKSTATASNSTIATSTVAAGDGEPQKKSNLVAGLALILGVVGTGLGAYAFNEIRTLKSTSSTQDLQSQLTALDGKVVALSKDDAVAALKQQIADLNSQQAAFKAAEDGFNTRIATLEQIQKGLTKSVQNDVDAALSAKMTAVDDLVAKVKDKVKDIELGQQGLSKNLTQMSAASDAIRTKGMAKQEVGYLLRMANYKLQSEGDVTGALGLLRMAKDQLTAANEGKTDAVIDAIRTKEIQLSGVTPVDTNQLIASLKDVSKTIPNLKIKLPKAAESNDVADDKGADEASEPDLLNRIGSVITSGVKFTPADPDQINITAETILIEKRLMQADVKTAEFAVQSHNSVLLAESIDSIQKSLNKYFADDATAKSVKAALNNISNSELKTQLPDLSELVRQFEASQTKQ